MAVPSDSGVDQKLDDKISAEAVELAPELSQACLSVDLKHLLAAVDFTPIVLDQRFTIGEVLRTSATHWLALTYQEEINRTAARLGASADVHALLLKKLASETSSAQAALVNRLTPAFFAAFCDERGLIDWPKLVEFNSGNMTR